MDIKQQIIELCDSMAVFWDRLKKEIEATPNEDNAELVCRWHNHFEEHGDAISKLSETKFNVTQLEKHLITQGELKYKND